LPFLCGILCAHRALFLKAGVYGQLQNVTTFIKKTLIGFCLIASSPSGAASSNNLIAHRAVYELQLKRADEKTGIIHLSGRMVYEFNGSYCAGFSTRFRYVSRIEMEENAPHIYDQQTSLFEAGDGRALRIISKNYTNDDLTYELDATAGLEETGIVVYVDKPEAKIHHLAPALFPTAQMMEILRKAEEGVSFYQTALYDDFETGNKITKASVVIGKPRPLVQSGEMVWPVVISYFDDMKNPDGLPAYSSQFLIDKGGITHDIMFDYGDYSIGGTLTQLDVLEQEPCDD